MVADPDASLRVSDAERDVTLKQLEEHAAVGRLPPPASRLPPPASIAYQDISPFAKPPGIIVGTYPTKLGG